MVARLNFSGSINYVGIRELKNHVEVYDDEVCWLGWTGTRTSVSAGKRKLTTTTLNVNINVKLWCSFATKFFRNGFFKNNARSYFLSRTSNFIDDEIFVVLSGLFEWKNPCFRYYSTFNLRWPSPSVCQSLDLKKETFRCGSCFPSKVYFSVLMINDFPYLTLYK